MKKVLRKIISAVTDVNQDVHSDFEELHNTIWNDVNKNTMTSKERIYGLIEAVKYITRFGIEGDIVECGVWKGGSMMAVAKTLLRDNSTDRQLYLYDTYEGMSEPTEADANFQNESAESLLAKSNRTTSSVWAYSALETVQQGMATTKYPAANIHYVKGKVEDTIPADVPGKIALLRLDTDWYESTKHELVHLFPKLQRGGVLIIDDYGFWKGARKAVDEYFAENKVQILLSRMDNTGRIAIKQ